MVGRHAERDPGLFDLPLRARQPPFHRLGLDEERTGDLFGREPSQRSQRQRHLPLERKRRMAAREDQLEPLVRKRRLLKLGLVHRGLRRLLCLEQLRLLGERGVASDAVDCAVASGDRQPCARVGRHAVAWPALRRGRECLLRRFFREIEVAEPADERREDAAPLVAEDLVDQRAYRSTIGRTSTAPPMRAAGIRAARASAASRLSASSRKKPPRYSLASTNGPSLRSASPFCTRTVVADSAPCSCWPPRTPGSLPIASYSPITDLSWLSGMSRTSGEP